MTTMPRQLARSLAWDRGKEMFAHAWFRVETGILIFFADPHSAWQRGTNENTNGLRQHFPKGTDLPLVRSRDRSRRTPNIRPCKTIGCKTPAEAFNEQLLLLQQADVATTDRIRPVAAGSGQCGFRYLSSGATPRLTPHRGSHPVQAFPRPHELLELWSELLGPRAWNR